MHGRIQKRAHQAARLTKLRARAGFDRADHREARGGPQTATLVQSSKKEKRTLHQHLPDFDQRLYPVQKLAPVVAVLGEEGVGVSDVLHGSDLTPADFSSASTRISYRQMTAVYGNAIRLSKDPTVAFQVGRRMHITTYGMYGYALLSCPNRAAAAEFASKYTMAVGPTFSLNFLVDQNCARHRFLEVISQDPSSDLYRFSLEFTLAMLVTVSNDLFDRQPEFSYVRIAYPPPAHASAYTDLFQCPVFFNATVNEVEISPDSLAEPIACANPNTLELGRRACEEILKEAEMSSGLASLVRQALLQTPNSFPPVEVVATDLGLSPRQLHRNLQAENTSYRKILDEIRMGLALAYLRKTHITTDDIAIRLGYSDGANFRHAFRRWTGKSTSDFRAKA
jgi:AraC-like DNA-binding protein